MATVTIKAGDQILAQGELGSTVLDTDGNYYFSPSVVSKSKLLTTTKTYTCPYKGVCLYVNLVDDAGQTIAEEISWIYGDPKSGWEHIQSFYGFYKYNNHGLTVEVTE